MRTDCASFFCGRVFGSKPLRFRFTRGASLVAETGRFETLKTAKMKFYRLTFLKNDILSCIEAVEPASELPYFEHDNGQLIFALVRAETQQDAIKAGLAIAEDVRRCHDRK